jgi:hypothetical protein
MKKYLLPLLALFAQQAMAQTPSIPFTNLSVPRVQAQIPVQASFLNTCYSTWLPGTEHVSTAGNVVTLTLPIQFEPGTICFDPPLPTNVHVPIGQFAAGEYILVLQPVAPVPPQPGVNYSAISVPFSVVGEPPAYSHLRLYPNPALVDQLVTARIRARDFFAQCFRVPLSEADVQHVDNLYTLSIRESNLDTCLIGVPPPAPYDFDVGIGRFSAGSYTLRVHYVPDLSGGQPLQILSGDFVVGSALAIPVASRTMLVLLALGIALFGGWQRHRNGRGIPG